MPLPLCLNKGEHGVGVGGLGFGHGASTRLIKALLLSYTQFRSLCMLEISDLTVSCITHKFRRSDLL